MIDKNFYLTTPLYYVNDIPHIGHAYTTTLADVISRYHKLYGYDVFLMTGTDEHGQKVQQAATKREVDPQTHVDEYNVRFKDLWTKMNIDYDFFIRTTQEDHKACVKEQLQKLYDQDLIYSELYAGWYSVGEERFFGEEELVDGKDPISGREVEWLEEKNYFFKMGSYQKQLIAHIENNPGFIVPEFRANEVLGFLKNNLRDLCISRPKSRLEWGIPLPFDEDYVTYVWFDALLNYYSGVKGRKFKDGTDMWPANFHLIGKDILTTHSVYWITMLMALEIPLPKHILAHGWWMNGGAKMSKSGGTAIDPIPYMDKFGVDSFRYYVIRDMVLGNDASFTDEAFERRINSELANDLGNGLNRVHKLLSKNFDNIIPECPELGEEENDLHFSKDRTATFSQDKLEVYYENNKEKLDQEITWEVLETYKETDGYTDPRKVRVAPISSNGDLVPDRPLQFEEFVDSTDEVYFEYYTDFDGYRYDRPASGIILDYRNEDELTVDNTGDRITPTRYDDWKKLSTVKWFIVKNKIVAESLQNKTNAKGAVIFVVNEFKTYQLLAVGTANEIKLVETKDYFVKRGRGKTQNTDSTSINPGTIKWKTSPIISEIL